MVILFLADGFEEIEALATVDVLRRAGLEVCTVGIGGKRVTGSHGIVVEADVTELPPLNNVQAVVLPGGLPGTTHLDASPLVEQCLRQAAATDSCLLCAICAAPSVLGKRGMLSGKRATCYPGYESELHGATATGNAVEVDGNRITAKGAGVTLAFALAIVARLISPEKAKQIGDAMKCR